MTNDDRPAIIEDVTNELDREAKEATGDLVEHTSFSRLDTYLRCGFKYMLKYELGIKGAQNLNMARGSAGHRALELNARHKIATGDDMPTEQILDLFNASFDAELQETELAPGDSPDYERSVTHQILTVWRHKYAKLVTPLAVELEFLLPMPALSEDEPAIPPIMGFIDEVRSQILNPEDRRKRGERRTALIDRKFPGRKPSDGRDRATLSHQLTIYDTVLYRAGKIVDDIGFEFYIPPTKTIPARIEPAYRPLEMMTPEAREARHARTEFTLRRAYRNIRRGDTYIPVDDPRTCSQCELRKICQFSLAKDDYIAEKLTREQFTP